ncbi:SRPBCC domain-containing protein [Chryseosolibacter indicus]|uniref:SRPBCC domain-containing protein n=1 Tax=Chryseosolibacter indicus TaxID=2782351 RepID=A0ABS5VU56_9BACT|nr:SRPBCC domain-containing protein [Chryseosolibacter indicus]MBT1704299.1 SRPBCC domain-containing protein [Chryseosolibacter indicus]
MIKTIFSKDLSNKKMSITREFAGTVEEVWQAWTSSEILDEWWAPKPWKAETKRMDFKEGGEWLYSMNGPEGEKMWTKVDFRKIETHQYFEAKDFFCDENGIEDKSLPSMVWKTSFTPSSNGTTVAIDILFSSIEDMQKIVEMGFETGFSAAHENLDQYLQSAFKLRKELKISNAPRVTTYLNFPGNTEEVFTFYKSVFKSEFSGRGLKRFGDLPAEAGHPPIAENVKNMVLHVELPILGGHVLMASDAPKEMGFTVNQGNNMYICLEPDTREETKRLFDALSDGGTVTMPLDDMFFGSYFGTCIDKFGINWMFSCNYKK